VTTTTLHTFQPAGYKLTRQGRQLLEFVAYLERPGATTVTIEHAMAWAAQPAGDGCDYWCDRLSVARRFARYVQTIDPASVDQPAWETHEPGDDRFGDPRKPRTLRDHPRRGRRGRVPAFSVAADRRAEV
jgi:hypothetical protein